MSSLALYFICGSNEPLREGTQRNWRKRTETARIVRSMHSDRVSNDVTSNSSSHRSSLATFHKTMSHFQVLYWGANLDHINPYFVLETLLGIVRLCQASQCQSECYRRVSDTSSHSWNLLAGKWLFIIGVRLHCANFVWLDLIPCHCAIGEKGRQKAANRFYIFIKSFYRSCRVLSYPLFPFFL